MYMTISDFAERAHITKQAVYQRIKRKNNNLEIFTKTVNGKMLISDKALTQFVDAAALIPDNTPDSAVLEIDETEQQVTIKRLNVRIAELETKLEAATREVERQASRLQTLEELNAAQRELIDDARQQRDALNERLREAHILASTAQQLALPAGAAQQNLQAENLQNAQTQNPQNAQASASRKYWWERIWGGQREK